MKEFKTHSHVQCPEDIKLRASDQLVIEELNIPQQTFFRERRHSFLDPMDTRDFLEPDKYHRYERIIKYLKVKIIYSRIHICNLYKIFRIFPRDMLSWSSWTWAGAMRTGASWL